MFGGLNSCRDLLPYILNVLITHCYFLSYFLASLGCAILIHTLPGEKFHNIFITTSEAHAFLCNYNYCTVVSVEG